jgi:Zn-dependent peptidase ImmA (M78 family)/transcriptional regulator with XRE-family HTH domain
MRQQEQINPQLLILAREFRGLSQTKLSAQAGVTQSALAQLELGNSSAIGEGKLSRVTQALGFPDDFFYSSEPRLGFGSSSYFYRKKITKASDKNYVSGLVNLFRIHLTTMLNQVDIEPSSPLMKIHVDEDTNPAQIARRLRSAWNIPDGPIQNLTHFIEKAGIVIIESPFGTSTIDGTSLSLNNLPHIIFINDSLPPDRFRFTLAHELGHIIMHDFPHEMMELEADAFASELLIPEKEFRESIAASSNGKYTIAQLIKLKPYWKVAITAMMRKLLEIGRISSNEYKQMYITLAKNKLSRNEPQPFPKESPALFKQILEVCLGDYSNAEANAESLLNLYKDDFKLLYGAFLPQPKLRIVSRS